MGLFTNIGGQLKEIDTLPTNIGGQLKEISSLYANIDGQLKEIFNQFKVPKSMDWTWLVPFGETAGLVETNSVSSKMAKFCVTNNSSILISSENSPIIQSCVFTVSEGIYFTADNVMTFPSAIKPNGSAYCDVGIYSVDDNDVLTPVDTVNDNDISGDFTYVSCGLPVRVLSAGKYVVKASGSYVGAIGANPAPTIGKFSVNVKFATSFDDLIYG